jgi:exonuclease SbcD
MGGAATVPASHFTPYGYTALGHLHRPQQVAPNVHYSGSLLKYSFSEADHVKGVVVGEMDSTGRVTTRLEELTPRHDVRRVTGYFDELIAGPGNRADANDYLEFSLLDKTPVLDAMARLRQVYPNALSVRRPAVEFAVEGYNEFADLRKVSHEDLFGGFFKAMTGDELTADEREAFLEVLVDTVAIEEAA